ncbi:MAG: TrkH family potassium uptake protein [Dehalococcoidia bacterium]|nr:TrkH family potassium uptake protein [Dehalococcoidia bacterium]
MQAGWRPRPGDRVLRRALVIPQRISVLPGRIPKPSQSPWSILVYGFAGIIAVGAVLLTLPISSAGGGFTSPVDALFTATSAICVTGLVVLDTGTYWSGFGQAVILVLIQLGGLGYMTMSTLILLVIGRRITLQERLRIKETMGVPALGGLVRLIRTIFLITIAIEAVGAILLFLRFAQIYRLQSVWTTIWQAVFHSVSAFNNAGFDIVGPNFRSLAHFQRDPWILLVIAGLIILGGLSFVVMVDVARNRRFSRLSVNSKIVLAMTGLLLGLGTIAILVTEYGNLQSLGPLPFPYKVLNAFFTAVTPRTAGFTTLDLGRIADYTLVLVIALMFIGGASGSTAGGIKVNTFGVLVAVILAAVKGRQYPEMFRKEVPQQLVHQALAVVFLAFALVFAVVFVLTLTESASFLRLVFETVSAFGTVGLSTGITPELSTIGKLVIMFVMFVGRVGPLSLGLAFAARRQPARYRYAQESVQIG